MDKWRETWWGMILGSMIRHAITAGGAMLATHGWLDDKALGALTSHQDVIVGVTMIALGLIWSAASKTKFLTWVRVALHMDRNTTLGEVKVAAAQQKPAAKVPLVLAAAVLSAALAAATMTSCTSAGHSFDGWKTTAASIVNVEDASRYYLMSADIYGTIMRSLVDLRAQHRIDDGTWAQIEGYRDRIGTRGQQLGTLLKLWRLQKSKPADFDEAYTDTVHQLEALQDLYGGLR